MFKAQKPFLFEHGPRAVILLHAYASGPNDVRLLARTLERENYTVFAPLFTGHSTGEPLDILRLGDPNVWWQDVKAAIEYLRKKGYQSISIFGLSLGGAYAIKALEMDNQLVAGGSFSAPVLTESFSDISDEFYRLADMTYNAQELNETEKLGRIAQIRQQLPDQLALIDAETANIATHLSDISQPTFVAQGGADELVSPESGKLLSEELNHSDVSFKWYEKAGHALTVNSAHKQLEADISQFLKSIYSDEE